MLPLPRAADGTLLPAISAGLLALMALLQLALTRPVELAGQAMPAGRMQADLPDLAAVALPADPGRLPLFAPERNQGGPQGAQASPLGGPVLAGSIAIRGRTAAILQMPDGSVRRLAVGGRIGSMVLRAVSSDGAIFTSGGRSIRVGYGRPAAAPPPQDQNEDITE